MLEKLERCIERVNIDMEMRTRDVFEFVLWLSFLGGISAPSSPRRDWFLTNLSKTAMVLEICSWDEVKLVLGKFIWFDRLHEAPFLNLWEEVRLLSRWQTEGSDSRRHGVRYFP